MSEVDEAEVARETDEEGAAREAYEREEAAANRAAEKAAEIAAVATGKRPSLIEVAERRAAGQTREA